MKRSVFLSLALLLAACGDGARDALQGYGEADYIYLASQETGVIREVLVREGEHVAAGARVFTLEPERLQYNAATAGAQSDAAAAAVRTAQADAVLAERNYARGLELFERGFYPRARLDADRAARDAANARLAQARREAGAASAATGLAQERLADTSGAAPVAGVIDQIYHRPGEVVPAGQPIAALLAPSNMKVRFFAPQDMLPQLPVGARVSVSCDGCEQPIPATVSFVAAEPQFTPPVIYSLDQREKLVFLVEARLDAPSRIRPGMPVDIRIAE
ncbi:MAG TPA: efflux RND transporter periplasmic adaptor subunit [Vitreimonas sp.]|uniref:HlyD family secretion protein n=1 Tax=Vitreimonas sp. TaxID=3069702 RepID=UPI002D521EA4|nr:efflux RND transporter periplasmic adaptor subunit [Vitreimonas sp.]HYD88572.1 efflux RND transporter periplasmic adaptor subunit [Vitreimonas sp.]